MNQRLNTIQLLALKARTRRLVKLAGGVESCALISRVSKTQIGNYQNPELLDSFMPIDVVVEIESDVGKPIISEGLAELAGCTLSPVIRPVINGSLTTCLSRLGKEFGDVFERAAQFVGTSHMTASQRDNLLRDIEEAIGACVAIRDAVMDAAKETETCRD